MPTQLQLPVRTNAPAAFAALMVSLMIAPPPMTADFLSLAMVTWLRPARLSRTPLVPRLKVLPHPLPPFCGRNGILFFAQYLT